MDENQDIKAPSAIPATAGDPANPAAMPPAEPATAVAPLAFSKSELANIASPTIASMATDMAAETPGLDAPKIERPIERPAERPLAAETIEPMKPPSLDDAAPASRETMLAVPAAASASGKRGKFTLLAAAVVLAAAFGAMAGVLGATGVARLAGDTATAPEPTALQSTLAQLRSEVAALKASVDTTSRNTGTQYSKLVERFDRVERAQSVANKSDAALPKETTGSVTPPGAAAALPPAAVPSSGNVQGWAVRDVYRGVAMLRSRAGGMVEVEPGDVLPGLGRIEAIRRQDGHWVVVTSKGMITSMR
jgi:hypothetical protein